MEQSPEKIQEHYYSSTAAQYDSMHVLHTDKEHMLALELMSSYISFYQIRSVLDIGAGTGRTLLFLKNRFPHLKVVGIEPVKALREEGYKKGLSEVELIDGDGNNLNLLNESYDLVCEYGVLHHVRFPEKLVEEMLRVAEVGVFISDSNNFGQGGWLARTFKQTLNFFSLWNIFNFIRTKGKRYQISKADGLFYSYSVFNNYKLIQSKCEVLITGIRNQGFNPYKSASHIALFGLKRK